jgi:addiction module HigA family antidote
MAWSRTILSSKRSPDERSDIRGIFICVDPAYRCAHAGYSLTVPRTRIERIAREEKPVTVDTALRLDKFFRTGAAFWMNIQARFDLETAEDALAPRIKIASYEAAASRLTR